MFKSLVLSTALSFVAVTSWAQTGPARPAAEPATPEQIATTRAHADSIIAKAAAADVFTNVTNGKRAEIRHNRSGMTCSFEVGDGSVTIFQGLPRGDDVGCTERVGAIVLSTYATRFPEPLTVDQVFDMSLRALQQGTPTAKPYTGEVTTISATGLDELLPKTRVAYFGYERAPMAGQTAPSRVVTRLAVAMRGEWALKQRISGPEAEATTLSMLGETAMFTMLLGMLTHDLGAQSPAPAAPRPAGSPPIP